MRKIKSRRRGYTLVEIMIVVAIIGLLAAIAVPNYAQSRMVAHRNVCISNLQQIEGAIQRWALEMHKDEGQAVTYSEIRSYLGRSVVCPSGGTSFEDSYTITTVEAAPTCQRKAGTHKPSCLKSDCYP
jgi:prepilin-type N-terminal cleavage/methylation domain-containing protein